MMALISAIVSAAAVFLSGWLLMRLNRVDRLIERHDIALAEVRERLAVLASQIEAGPERMKAALDHVQAVDHKLGSIQAEMETVKETWTRFSARWSAAKSVEKRRQKAAEKEEQQESSPEDEYAQESLLEQLQQQNGSDETERRPFGVHPAKWRS